MVVVQNVESHFKLMVRLFETTCVSRRSVQSDLVPHLELIFSQEIDGLRVKCNEILCSWVGKKVDYGPHWTVGCPVRATRRVRFAPIHNISQRTERDSDCLILESCESVCVCPFTSADQLSVSKL